MNLFYEKIPYSKNRIEYFFENSDFSKKGKYYFIEDSKYFYSDFGLFIENCHKNLSQAMYFTTVDVIYDCDYSYDLYTYDISSRHFDTQYVHLFVREHETELYRHTYIKPINLKKCVNKYQKLFPDMSAKYKIIKEELQESLKFVEDDYIQSNFQLRLENWFESDEELYEFFENNF